MRRRKSVRIAAGGMAAGLLALLCLAAPALAQAAPQYEDSEPNDGASVTRPPAIVSVSFNEPIDESSTMAVENGCGDRVDGGNVAVELNEMRIDVPERHYSGVYTVTYTAVGIGGVTGSTNGSFEFTAAEGHPCDGGHDKDHDDHDRDKHEHDKDDHDKDHGDKDHDDHEGRDHESSDHGDHETHTMTGHTSTSHSAQHSGHQMSSDGGHAHDASRHQEGTHSDGHDQHGSARGELASGPLPQLPADGRAVLIALGLCAVMGIIGGLFLRNSTN